MFLHILKTDVASVLYGFMLTILELALVHYCAHGTKERLKSSQKKYLNVPQMICHGKY